MFSEEESITPLQQSTSELTKAPLGAIFTLRFLRFLLFFSLEVRLVQLQVLDGLVVLGLLGLGQAVEHGRGDDVLHPVEVQVVQVLPRPDVAVRGVVLHLEHLLVEFVRDVRRLFQSTQPVSVASCSDLAASRAAGGTRFDFAP